MWGPLHNHTNQRAITRAHHVVGDVVLGARVGAAVGEMEGDSVVGVAEGAGEGDCVGTALGVRNMPSSASMAWLIS